MTVDCDWLGKWGRDFLVLMLMVIAVMAGVAAGAYALFWRGYDLECLAAMGAAPPVQGTYDVGADLSTIIDPNLGKDSVWRVQSFAYDQPSDLFVAVIDGGGKAVFQIAPFGRETAKRIRAGMLIGAVPARKLDQHDIELVAALRDPQ